ncbi:5-oxoprolinase subunit PxpB [Aquibacillus salsiterrae]|uniref:5-oxoprolinase subunit PxpB n=1 Tax=Aquibacillus salsiterrae TaxID=2950439 RepID=A0A9X3WEU3_9BACI|nr:5-oxoprolinase subunit PxpB [Aquibacillus salsiterrae]MDC3416099.1 5-oxoprolinase subunit PxpB [Aquibacillus salsiterrae]
MESIRFFSLSESAIMIDFGQSFDIDQNKRLLSLTNQLTSNPFPGFVECVPAYSTLTIYFDPTSIELDHTKLIDELRYAITVESETNYSTKSFTIPVCYEPEFGIDLQEVADYHQLTSKQVVELHTKPTYHVYFLGFSPGFPFLGGMDQRIATPRKKSPRIRIEAGSVGIAGRQTGIYPSPTPGGWKIIGRTPIPLVDLSKSSPTILHPGDKLNFQAISKDEFMLYQQGELLWEW